MYALKKAFWSFLIALICFPCGLIAQKEANPAVLRAVVIDGDTIPLVMLEGVSVSEQRFTRSKRYDRQYGRLLRKVLKTYPYAKVTKELLEGYDEELAKLKGEKDKRDYLDIAEAELKAEFEGEIQELTVSEGKILIKLIDRETGDTSYELIKQLKGGFNAFMWQSLARLFGSDLKAGYDPLGDDRMIEAIVQEIERGDLYVPPREAISPKAQQRLDKKRKRQEEKIRKRNGGLSTASKN
jgi:hypothetical protein